jgi:trehalose synthase
MLRSAVPVLSSLGLATEWEVSGGDAPYFATSSALQAALEGAERALTDAALEHYLETNRLSGAKLRLEADLVVVHDVQPAGLVHARRGGCWLWRCHFDCSAPQQRAWSFFRPLAELYDATLYSTPGFAGRVGVPAYFVMPSIDPLSEKNRDMSYTEVEAVLAGLGVVADKPLLVQIGPLTAAADPLGVVNAYRLVRKHHDVRLILAGIATEDAGSGEVLADLRRAAERDDDLVLLELPAEAHRQINALQRAATIVFLKSHRGGFGLSAAEAMWKGKPVIGGAAGGLRQQVIAGVTGFVIHSVEGAAFRVRQLLNNPEQVPRMGAAGREHVRRAFLLTRHLTDYLALMSHLTR